MIFVKKSIIYGDHKIRDLHISWPFFEQTCFNLLNTYDEAQKDLNFINAFADYLYSHKNYSGTIKVAAHSPKKFSQYFIKSLRKSDKDNFCEIAKMIASNENYKDKLEIVFDYLNKHDIRFIFKVLNSTKVRPHLKNKLAK